MKRVRLRPGGVASLATLLFTLLFGGAACTPLQLDLRSLEEPIVLGPTPTVASAAPAPQHEVAAFRAERRVWTDVFMTPWGGTTNREDADDMEREVSAAVGQEPGASIADVSIRIEALVFNTFLVWIDRGSIALEGRVLRPGAPPEPSP